MLSSLLAVLAVLTVRSRFDDPDLWWHLKTGEIVCTTHSVPVTDLFSYTTNHQSSVPQEWLSQVAIYGAWKLGGNSGLMLWLCALSAALLIAGYLLCWFCSGNAKVAFMGAMTIWFFSTIGLSIRPQMIGYLLLITELFLIHLGRTRNPRWFLCLPVLFALWVNCHGSFLLGIVVAGVFLFTSFFSFQAGSIAAPRWDPQCRKMLIFALILSAAALFLNPDGIRQLLYPIDTMVHQPVGLGSVEEWGPLRLTDARGVALLLVLLSSFLLVAVRRSELFLDELLMLTLGTWLAVGHVRMLFVFGILAAPVLSRQLSNSWENYEIERDRIWPNAVLIGISIAVIIFAFPSSQNLEDQVEAASPVKAVEFIKANHLSGPMLNDYTFGGYLIWSLPEIPVFVDGRGDVYEWSGVLSQFGDWATLRSDPNVLLQKYKINFCLLNRESPMVRVLPLLREWKIVYTDKNSAILVRTAPPTSVAP
ncbi:MAG: hypothetical protein ABR956_16800 [Terracidiphilus sp.]|jgi:hypothetical protein